MSRKKESDLEKFWIRFLSIYVFAASGYFVDLCSKILYLNPEYINVCSIISTVSFIALFFQVI